MCERLWFSFLFLFFLQNLAHVYPSFIGYEYSSCITCHYNGHGGGALNDYGRALPLNLEYSSFLNKNSVAASQIIATAGYGVRF